MVPAGLIELDFGDEAQLTAAQRTLGEHHQVNRVDSKLLVATTGSVTDIADLFIRLNDHRIEPTGFSRQLPTLDDVFFKILDDHRRTDMRTLTDTWTMTKRSLRHTTRSLDTIITVVVMPIAVMLLFVYVFGGALGQQTGSIAYVDFITPGVVIMTVVSGIAYAAVRLSTDLQKGIISRFRTMPVTPSSVLSGQALSSTLSNLFSCTLVILVALLVGFRPAAGPASWLTFCGLLVLFTLATTWLAICFGLLAKTVEGAGAFSYLLLLLIFISPAFVPTDSMTPWLRSFAQHQPMTPIIETMRSLLTENTPGPHLWVAYGWAAGILLVSFTFALGLYGRSTPVPAAQ